MLAQVTPFLEVALQLILHFDRCDSPFIHFTIYEQFEWSEQNSQGKVIILNCMVVLNRTNYSSIKCNAQIELSFNYFNNNKHQLMHKCMIILYRKTHLRCYFQKSNVTNWYKYLCVIWPSETYYLVILDFIRKLVSHAN